MEVHTQFGYALLTLFVLCWAGGLISWCFAAYYMFKVNGRFRPERRWGRFLPFSFLMPSFFTDEGNIYRIKLLRAGGLFFLFVGAAWAAGMALSIVSPDQ